jgi:hypothetical protein
MAHLFTRLVLMGSLALAGCDRSHVEARRALASSTALRYVGCALYLDGGSMGFMFTNQAAQPFVVFVPNPWLGEGVVEKDGRKIQKVLMVSKKEFASEEPMELPVRSRAEAKVSRLVQTALQESLSEDRREEIYSLLEILAERTFDWDAFQKGHIIPRAKGRAKPNHALELTAPRAGARVAVAQLER